MDYLKTFRDMISLRGLTEHTVTAYSTYIRAYLNYLTVFLKKSPEDISWQEMRDFLSFLQKQRSLSERTMNAVISQLRFFHIYVLHKTWDDTQLPLRRFDTYLPFVPTREQVWQFIFSFDDIKIRAMISLMYSSGLRIGELCLLRYKDIDRRNMRIYIANGKNRSGRYAALSKLALDILTEYWFSCGRPIDWLFPSQRDDSKPFVTNHLKYIIKKQRALFPWAEELTSHSFRHAYATHLYENGTDLLTLKALMRHQSLSSTAIYVSFYGRADQSRMEM